MEKKPGPGATLAQNALLTLCTKRPAPSSSILSLSRSAFLSWAVAPSQARNHPGSPRFSTDLKKSLMLWQPALVLVVPAAKCFDKAGAFVTPSGRRR